MKTVDSTAQKVTMVYLFLLIHLNAFSFDISSLFWDITQRGLVVMYRRFGTTHITYFQGPKIPRRSPSWTAWSLKMGPISCPETSVHNYQSTLRNIPEGRSHLHGSGSLKAFWISNKLFKLSQFFAFWGITFHTDRFWHFYTLRS